MPSAPATKPSVLRRTVARVVEVVPEPLLALLGLLGVLAAGFGAISALTGLRARRLRRHRDVLAADVDILQAALVPALAGPIGAAAVTGSQRPGERAAAAADFYDAFPLPGGCTGVVVGTVGGDHRGAVPLAVLTRFTVRTHLERGLEPRLALQESDVILFDHLRGREAHAVAAVYDPMTGQLTYACTGDATTVLLDSDQPPAGAAASPPLGSGTTTGRRQVSVALPPGAAARLGAGALGPDGDAGDVASCLLRPLDEAAAAHPSRTQQVEVRGGDLLSARAFIEESGGDPAALMPDVRRTIAECGSALLEARWEAGAPCTVGVRAPA